MLKTKQSQKGFTIVELLIVIVVIGILAALVISTFTGIQARARDTQRDTDTASVIKAAEAYAADAGNGQYPTNTVIEGTGTIAPLDSGIITKLQTMAADPTSTQASTHYRYAVCVESSANVGVQVKYWKEQTGAVVTKNAGKTTGGGVTCS